MADFRIVPISKEFANKVRRKGKDEFGNSVIEEVATGLGPCRVSLRPFRVGVDERLIFSYSPFSMDNPYNQRGPIFIHKKDVEEYTDIHTFPKLIEEDKENFPISIIGYNKNQIMIFTQRVGNNDVDSLIKHVFMEHPEIEYLHARNSEAGCYFCKIVRVNNKSIAVFKKG